MSSLTPEQLSQYQHDGYISPIDIFSAEEVKIVRDEIESIEKNWPDELIGVGRNNVHMISPVFDEVVHNSKILDAVEDLIGRDILAAGTTLFIKDPEKKSFVSWHQDAKYQGFKPHNFVTAWVAITDSNKNNGCMLMWPGSHSEIKDHQDTFDENNIPVPVEGTEKRIEADLIVAAIGQSPDIEGLDDLGNERGFFEVDDYYRHKTKEGHFVAGDIIRPHLLTTAIGQGSIVSQTIKSYFENNDFKRRPKVDVHHFNLLDKLRETDLEPEKYTAPIEPDELRGSDTSKNVLHNYEDRSSQEIIPSTELFLGHFKHEDRLKRGEDVPSGDEVIDNYKDRIIGLTEEEAIKEASRCMSCGMCFECDNCVIYCPQDAVFRVKKDEATLGRYVDTDYNKCIGCHICADVCPTGYIKMGLGE